MGEFTSLPLEGARPPMSKQDNQGLSIFDDDEAVQATADKETAKADPADA